MGVIVTCLSEIIKKEFEGTQFWETRCAHKKE